MRTRILRRLSCLACVVAAIGAAEPVRQVFAVGVLRRDGVVIPFAVFDGKNWKAPWPPPALNLDIPINVAGVPRAWWGAAGPLESWHPWIAGAVQPPIRVKQLDWVEAHCQRQIGLRTDYQAAAPPPSMRPYPKDGLAVSPAQQVEPIEILPLDGPEARALERGLLVTFNFSERKTEAQFGHPIARRAREGRAPTLEAIYAFGDSPRFYYVEASRPYRAMGQEDECTAFAFATGWFVRHGAAGVWIYQSIEMAVDLLNCDRRGASYMLPFGVIRANNRVFWLAQFSGWDHERYVVIDLEPKKVQAVISTWGGAC